jgi:hypothetical protein
LTRGAGAALAVSLGYFVLAFGIKVPPGPMTAVLGAQLSLRLGPLGMARRLVLLVRPPGRRGRRRRFLLGSRARVWSALMGALRWRSMSWLRRHLGAVPRRRLLRARASAARWCSRGGAGTALGFWIMFNSSM